MSQFQPTEIDVQDRVFADLVLGRVRLTNDQFVDVIKEGLLPLISNIDSSIQEEVRSQVHQAVALELGTQRVVAEVLSEMHGDGIETLVLKGTGLAYSLYDQPWQRSRGDTDLFIREADRGRATEVLLRLGFVLELPAIGSVGNCEESFYLSRDGTRLCIDLHWRLTNHWLLSAPIDFETLWRDKQAVPNLNQHAYRCSNVWSIIIACIHRSVHQRYLAYESSGFRRFESDFTIWIYDIHLLAAALTPNDWRQVSALSNEKRFGRLVADGLLRSHTLFDTKVPDDVMSELNSAANQFEPSLFSNTLSLEIENFSTVPAGFKLRLLRERLLPCRAHMDARYGSARPLALRHALRWLSGILRRLTPTQES